MRIVQAPIQAGCLTLTLHREEWSLEDCVTYATRQNPRRLYLFVSKVLGKHWPTRPTIMRAVHQRLAAKIAHLPGPLLVIGMAETATALGRGVAEEAALLTGREDVLYMQTTRCRLSRRLAFAFDEVHSHAPHHAVYWPEPVLEPLFRAARSLVLVDDEMSTGRTLQELASAYVRLNPHIEQIALASITCWLDEARQRELATVLERPLTFPALIAGEFHFAANPDFPLPILPSTATATATGHDAITTDPARFGVIAGRQHWPTFPLSLAKESGRKITVIGTGEYAYLPFRIALALEEAGYDVCCQSTTRSPMRIGDAIRRRDEFLDHQGDGIPNYLYNLDPERLPIVIYEHSALQAVHSLADNLGGLALAVNEKSGLGAIPNPL